MEYEMIGCASYYMQYFSDWAWLCLSQIVGDHKKKESKWH